MEGSSSGNLFSRRTWTQAWPRISSVVNRQGHDGKQGTKGPIGLTTIAQPNGNPLVDLIFIHGLNGGSFSSWTHNGDPTLFWPGVWLPRDEEFRDVRIHTFGYNSSWSHPSVLDIEDFAMALLGAISDCPHILGRDNEQKPPPLIFVGHSMGGLVIKRACALARSIDAFRNIEKRIISIFFLATPHHGADIARILTRLHGITGTGPLPFVEELRKNSATIQSINAGFLPLCGQFQLFSFFETRPMISGIWGSLIVEKECAIMGCQNERRIYLDANHRTVAKFSSKADSAYLTIRNALVAVIYLLRNNPSQFRQLLTEDKNQALDSFLQVSEAPVDILDYHSKFRAEGTCEWFFQSQLFTQWRTEPETKIFYMSGDPGYGKSVITSYIISQMQRNEVNLLARDCCYFFFRYNDKRSGTVESFLRSVIWQMSSLHKPIHTSAMEIVRNFQSPNLPSNIHAIFEQVFINGILKIKLRKLQFWIIDAIDECSCPQDLFNFLSIIQKSWPVYLFISSRPSAWRMQRQISAGILTWWLVAYEGIHSR